MEIQALDSVIALVVVLLLLSLIVQAIQGAFKKLLKVKSRNLEISLIDLFENALDMPKQENPTMMTRALENSPLLAAVQPSEKQAAPEVRDLLAAVRKEFEDIGRVAQSGRWALDSLAKEDLLKVMARIAPNTLLPNLLDDLTAACQQVSALEAALRTVGQSMTTAAVSGEASARFAALRQALVPLINDVRAIFDGQTQKLNVKLLIGDILSLREVKLEDIMGILAETQRIIDADLAAARNAQQDTTGLVAASATLRDLADKLADVHGRFDAALAPLRARLGSIETWFDTVMQSFEERYSRGMRTWALVISFVVVVVCNADFFTMARGIWSDDARRERIIAQADEVKILQQQLAVASPEAQAPIQEQIQKSKKQLEDLSSVYTSFGFQPLSEMRFRDTRHFFFVLVGWLVTTLLLSVGAPFWQDTLESLFGLKNLLRKRGGIQNVEQRSGEGHPRAT